MLNFEKGKTLCAESMQWEAHDRIITCLIWLARQDWTQKLQMFLVFLYITLNWVGNLSLWQTLTMLPTFLLRLTPPTHTHTHTHYSSFLIYRIQPNRRPGRLRKFVLYHKCQKIVKWAIISENKIIVKKNIVK